MSAPDLAQMTGDEIVGLLRRTASERGERITAFVRPAVVGKDINGYLRQLELSDRPTAGTLARIAALLAGAPLPRPQDAAPRRATPAPVRRGYVGADRVDVAPVSILARDPCWRCGVRADVGCAHRPQSEPHVAAMKLPSNPQREHA